MAKTTGSGWLFGRSLTSRLYIPPAFHLEMHWYPCDNERRQNLSAALNRNLLCRSFSGWFLCCSADQNTCTASRKNHPALSTLSQHSKETLPGCSKTLRLSVLLLSPGIGYYRGWWEFIWISPAHQYNPSELFKKRQSLLAVHLSLACAEARVYVCAQMCSPRLQYQPLRDYLRG